MQSLGERQEEQDWWTRCSSYLANYEGWAQLLQGVLWPLAPWAPGPVTSALPWLQELGWKSLSLWHRRKSRLGKCASFCLFIRRDSQNQ